MQGQRNIVEEIMNTRTEQQRQMWNNKLKPKGNNWREAKSATACMILFQFMPYLHRSRLTSKHFLMKKVLIYKNLCKILPTATTYKLGIWIYISLELNLSDLALVLTNYKNVWKFRGHSLASSRNLGATICQVHRLFWTRAKRTDASAFTKKTH